MFRTRNQMKSEFIVRSGKKIEKEWRGDWCWVRVEDPQEFILSPTELPQPRSGWQDRYHHDADLLPIVEKIKALWLAGLSDVDVARTFITRRITQLQLRSRPAWMYTGAEDRTRLRREGVDLESLQVSVRGISGETSPPRGSRRGKSPSTPALRGSTTSSPPSRPVTSGD